MTEILILLVEFAGVVAVTLLLGLSPAFQQRRPVVFVYPKREGVVALSLFVVMTGLLTLIFLQMNPSPGEAIPAVLPANGMHLLDGFTYTPEALARQAGLAGLMLLPFGLALLVRRQPLLSAGLSARTWRAGLEMGLALALITIFLTNKTYAILKGLNSSQWLYLAAMLIAGLAEEFVFRGYIQLRLMGWLGQTWGWVITSALFSLWHIPQQLLIQQISLPELAYRLGILFALGLLLGWIMRKTGNILAPGIYHAIHNWVAVV
jgi:membrane protease YdiL (CAAX protease family)